MSNVTGTQAEGHPAHEHHLVHGTHGGDYAQANKEHFTTHVHLFDTHPHAKSRAKRHVPLSSSTALCIAKHVALDKEATTVLEFACGNGLVVRELFPLVKSIVGIDISEAPVDQFNEYFAKEGVPRDRVNAICANIETDPDVLGGQTFDLVFCASAYHHLGDPQSITNLLAKFLKPGGALVVVDNWMTGDPTIDRIDEAHKHIVSKIGFTEEEMKALFKPGGVELEVYEMVPRDEGGDRDLFFAKGVLKGAN